MFTNQTIVPKKRLNEEYLKAYLFKSIKKYKGKKVDEVKGVYRSTQDGLSFTKNNNKMKISEAVAKIVSERGYILREEVTFEHKTPLSVYKHELHKFFNEKDKDTFWNLIKEKTDCVLVTKEEDARLRENKLTSSVPKNGADRYDVAGIKISERLLELHEVKYLQK